MSVGGGGRYRCIVAKKGKSGEEEIWQNALTLQRRSKRVGSTLTVAGEQRFHGFEACAGSPTAPYEKHY